MKMKFQTDKMNKWDYFIPIAIGAITAALDIFWVKDLFSRKKQSLMWSCGSVHEAAKVRY